MANLEFIVRDHAEPHRARGRQILAKYPQVKTLIGHAPSTSLFVFGITAAQVVVSCLLRGAPVWEIIIVAYLLGAILSHALFVLIHECTHNLVFKTTVANKLLAIFANFGQGFPVSMSFRKYHLIHHKSQGDVDFDADLPTLTEAKFVGNSRVKKALWLSMFMFIEGTIRPAALKKIKLLDRWAVINTVTVALFVFTLIYFGGYKPYLYLGLSTFFSVGLHPLGARWIQEHFVVKEDQETYSYYGKLNLLAFNVGYHNEHHDLILVPWSKLPALKKMAPEFYDSLYSHQSWVGLLKSFIVKDQLNLYSRVIRSPDGAKVSPL